MHRPLRLRHSGVHQYFIVDGTEVYGDLDHDGRIAKSDRYTGPLRDALVAAARHLSDFYAVPFPGAKSLDPEIASGGRLNDKEVAVFTQGSPGVIARRPDLMGHLDFFDRASGDGIITVRENFRSWRDLGYGVGKSLVLTLGSSAVFGRPADGFGIDVERIAEKRPTGSTGIYGPDGNVDESRLAEWASVFDPAGVLTHDQFIAALAKKKVLGKIPARQFQSLLALTARANRSRTITKGQFISLFDNTLFWVTVSMPRDANGRRL